MYTPANSSMVKKTAKATGKRVEMKIVISIKGDTNMTKSKDTANSFGSPAVGTRVIIKMISKLDTEKCIGTTERYTGAIGTRVCSMGLVS